VLGGSTCEHCASFLADPAAAHPRRSLCGMLRKLLESVEDGRLGVSWRVSCRVSLVVPPAPGVARAFAWLGRSRHQEVLALSCCN